MKHILHSTMAILLALATACSDAPQNELPTPQDTPIEVRFGADLPTATRADIAVDEAAGTFHASWTADDRLTVFANYQKSAFTYNPSSRYFEGQLTPNATQWTYQAVAPHATNAVQIPFGTERTQQGNRFNAAYYPLISEPIKSQGAVGQDDAGQPITFRFKSLTAIVALTFESADALVGEEQVRSIRLTAEGDPLTADFFEINRAEQSGTLSTAGRSQTITLNYAPATEPTAKQFKAYFNLPAGTYTHLQAEITTDHHTAKVRLAGEVTLTAGELVYATKTITKWTAPAAAPRMEWVENPQYTRQEIRPEMAINIRAQAEAGIEQFAVRITSRALASLLPMFGFEAVNGMQNTMVQDLAGDVPNADIMAMLFAAPAPATLKGKTEELKMNLSQLVPMIAQLPDNEGDHTFHLRMTDREGRTLERTLTFFILPQPAVTISEVNRWTNTAKATLKNIPQTALLQYKRSTEQTWQNAEGSGSVRTIAPRWIVSSNGTKRPDRMTGIFAEATYDWRVTDQGRTLLSGTIAKAAGATIPTLSDGTLSCYTTTNTATNFWGSGNNNFATGLCTYVDPYASLQAYEAMGILTPGNVFTGTFQFSLLNGTVKFGQAYDYKGARPTALRVSYDATIGKVTHTKHETHLAKGAQDQAMIMVAIVDWSAQHPTTSGMNTPQGVWNPATREGLTDEEKNGLIAYGVYYITQSEAKTGFEIPLHFYSDTASEPSGAYSIVISCATSRYGDYLNGSKDTKLKVVDFKWVY